MADDAHERLRQGQTTVEELPRVLPYSAITEHRERMNGTGEKVLGVDASALLRAAYDARCSRGRHGYVPGNLAEPFRYDHDARTARRALVEPSVRGCRVASPLVP